jgi:4'-phosphopantetheinyl transferase
VSERAQVWWAAPDDARAWHLELLDEGERARHAALARPADRARFLVGCALLRLVLAAHVGEPPARVALSRDCDRCGRPHGRPRLVGGRIEVSVSHSGERTVVAVALDHPVGVDVERDDEVLDVDAIARRLLTPAEAVAYSALPPADRRRGLLTYWTRKEAALKATGDGLRVAPSRLTVSGPDEEPRLLAWRGRPELAGRMTLHRLHAGPDHVASLAVLGTGVEVSELDGRPILALASGSGTRPD